MRYRVPGAAHFHGDAVSGAHQFDDSAIARVQRGRQALRIADLEHDCLILALAVYEARPALPVEAERVMAKWTERVQEELGIESDSPICNECAGSGEGLRDGTVCRYCNGSGVRPNRIAA